ncbi:MAG TPA: electron transfer flavoprotein subunit alpha/FixB family protein [Solirubrobacterales bacterium]|jgi:electron transfer flavoprotein alpha subunit|nr:electron transfer flavoprotein subunit alpha/FixB family protein [Solirubrobacterales bacterium]
MGDVLVYLESPVNDRLLAFARPLADAAGGALVALVARGEATDEEVPTAADVVLEVSHPALSPYVPEAHQAVLVAAIRERTPDVVVLENTTAGLDLAAGAAAATGLPFVGYCVDLALSDGEAQSVSGIYGGQLQATAQTSLPGVFAVNTTVLHEEPQAGGRGERVGLSPPAELESLRSAFLEPVAPPDEGVDLTKADRIVCVGRGIGGAENIPVAEELADALGAELGASRPVIDSGWLSKVRQVGKSGAHVTPKLYLSLGVSGAPEHVEGMQGAELIVAVNMDPAAAIFHIAHYGVVADLFDVAEELTELLAE